MYISLYCVFAVPLFLLVGIVYRGPFAWKLALMSPALPYAVWGLATFIDRASGGLGYVWYGNRDVMTYLQFLSPLVAAGVFAYVVVTDAQRNRRPVAHWLGIALLLIIVGQTLHFAGWHYMFRLLIPGSA